MTGESIRVNSWALHIAQSDTVQSVLDWQEFPPPTSDYLTVGGIQALDIQTDPDKIFR